MDLGFDPADIVSLSDALADAIFVEAGETWTDPTSVMYGTRVISIRRLLMQAVVEVDYQQNNTSEKASQRYDHLAKELLRWEDLLLGAENLAAESGSVRSGKPTQNPPRVKEYPWGWRW